MILDLIAALLIAGLFAAALVAVFRNTRAGFVLFKRLLLADLALAALVLAWAVVRALTGPLTWPPLLSGGVALALILYSLFGIRQGRR